MKIEVKGSLARLVGDATLIHDSGNPYPVEFTFSREWDGTAKTALFEAGGASVAVVLTDDRCVIPPECLKRAGVYLKIAVYGVRGEERICTEWCVTSMILHRLSLGIGQGGSTTTPDEVYEKVMAVIGDLSAAGFEGKTLSEVIIEIKSSISSTATDAEVDALLDETFASDEVNGILNEVFG